MEIVKPTDAELEAMLLEHSCRYPEKARFTVTGDGEKDVCLPVLLGNPSGACKMQEGKRVSPAWDTVIASTFQIAQGETNIDQLVSDSVLWPPPVTWFTWTKRWAALPEIVQVAIRRKTGSSMSMIEDPTPEQERPAALASILDRHPSAVWRMLKPPGTEIDAAIMPPDSASWRMFLDAMKRPNAKHYSLARNLATSSLVAASRADGTPISADELFDRWPGQALLVALTVSHLAGIAAKYELGFW